MSEPIILIPARMAASRLPGKPLLAINGEAMIVHVWRRACEAALGPVLVATDAAAIAEAVVKAGGQAILTGRQHASGTDRIHEAVQSFDPGRRFDPVINLQGDLPTIDPICVAAVIRPLAEVAADIATLASPIRRAEDRGDPNVVKVVGTSLPSGNMRALYFTRAAAPWGEGALYHHIGIYAYRRTALDRFVSLPPSPLENRERLEQLRALEAGMRIDVGIVETLPLGVDTPDDLERARHILRTR